MSGEYFFDKRTGALIRDAKIFSQLLAPSSSVEELHDRRQVGTTTGSFAHSKLGIHHLLAAFKKQNVLSEYVNRIVATARYEHLIDTIVDKEFRATDKLRADAQNALLSASLLANNTIDGLITPLMLLYGIAKQSGSILYTNADLEQLGDLAQQIRQELAASLERFDRHLLLTERLKRTLQLAKTEALMARDSLVRAPHLVLALLREASISEVAFLTDRNFKVEKLLMSVCRHHNIFSFSNVQLDAHSTIRFAPESRVILFLANDQANKLKAASISSSHLAFALLESQRWLRELVEGFTGSSVSTIVRRLEHCTSFQLSESNELNTTASSSTIELTVSFDNLDNQIEPWSQSKTAPVMDTIEDRLSKRSEIVLEHAILESKKLYLSSVSVETIMLGLLNETFGPTYQAFSILELDLTDARKILTASAKRHSGRTHVSRTLSVNALRLMERAWHSAQLLKMNRIDPEHIALAIAEEEHGVASFVCEALAIRGSVLRAEVITAMNKSKKCIAPF